MKKLAKMFVVLSIIAFAVSCAPKQECKDVNKCDSTQVDSTIAPIIDSTTTVK